MPLPSNTGKRTLTATVGATVAALLISYVPKFEGTVLRGYKDPIGIVTACTGDTKFAVLGRAYTPDECNQILQSDLIAHADGVNACITAPLTPYQRAAAISFAFNVGVSKFCGSTMARKFNAQDYAGACAEFSRWTYAGGQQYPGLVSRRATERKMCEGKLQ